MGGDVTQESDHGTTRPPARLIELERTRFDAGIFDLDGVVTDTASVHAAAWKQLFDEYLAERAEREGTTFRPFEPGDYLRHVDGKPRYDGVRDFLASRGIDVPEGEPSDPPARETVCGLGNRKDLSFNERLERDGISVFGSTVALLERMRTAGMGTALFSSSRNADAVLRRAGLEDLFDAVVGGIEAERLGLPGKPDPAVPLEAARRVGVDPARVALVEDATSGVEAGRRGGFGLVVGVDRGGNREALLAHGADVVVEDLVEVALVPGHPA
jgi:alpha,alpha-trehalase